MNTLSVYYPIYPYAKMGCHYIILLGGVFSIIFLIFTPDPWWDDPIFTNIFQMGLHHQLDDHFEHMFVELLPLPDFSPFPFLMNIYAYI